MLFFNPNQSEAHSKSIRTCNSDLKNNTGLDRNETVWDGYKFRNDLENFGLVRNEFQSETFSRVANNDQSRMFASFISVPKTNL